MGPRAGALVLVVDDDDDLRALYAELLVTRGYRVVTAASAREALARLDGVEVVVTDYAMPDGDGLELARAVRAHPVHCGVHLVMMSAAPPEEIRDAAEDVGAWFLAKPFDLDLLIQAIEAP